MSGLQTRTRPRALDPEGVENAHLKQLRALLEAAREAQGGARTELAGEINRVLAKIREPGNESEEARVLVSELDAHAFDDLLDDGGISSRKEAVNTLLSLGFPHALNVDPDDLDFARKEAVREKTRGRWARPRHLADQDGATPEETRRLQRTRNLALCLAGLGTLPLVIHGYTLLHQGSPVGGCLSLLQVLLTVLPTVHLSRVNPPLLDQSVPRAILLVSVGTALILAYGLGIPMLIAAGAALAAAIALWKY